MANIDRRRFLQLAGGTIAATMLSDSIARAASIPANRATQTIDDVEHIVVLMQENRSFDHYYGVLRGVRGFGDPHPITLPSGRPAWYQSDGATVTLPFRPQVDGDNLALTFIEDLDHSWDGTHQMFNGGSWDQWIASKGTTSMAHMQRSDLPFHYALADAFTVCDGYHCSMLGPTDTNRYYMWTGWDGNDGNGGGPVVANDEIGYDWMTYPERLQAAGISWKVYQDIGEGLDAAGSWGWTSDDPYIGNYGDNSLLYFDNYRNAAPGSPLYQAARTGTDVNSSGTFFDQLTADVQSGNLPQVSYIASPEAYTEHPAWPAGYGAWYTAAVLNALTSNPDTWSKTVLIINFDENDGFFDHVPAPYPNVGGLAGDSTVDTTYEMFDGLAGTVGGSPGTPGPFGGGVRVPLLAISPWSKGGYVCSETFDHTSVIRFMERRFGVTEPNITPWRRAVFGDLTSAFDFTSAADDVPTLPNVDAYEPNPAQTTPPSYQPTPPATGAVPVQEPGTRPSRPLAYDFGVRFGATADALQVAIDNPGTLGVGIQARSLTVPGAPYTYTVGAGDNLTENLLNPGAYDLSLHGPHGWFRHFAGSSPSAVEIDESFDSSSGQVTLTMSLTDASGDPLVIVIDDAFSTVSRQIPVSSTPAAVVIDTSQSGGWYDLALSTAADNAFAYQLAGRVETDAFALTSDPQLDGLSHQVAPSAPATTPTSTTAPPAAAPGATASALSVIRDATSTPAGQMARLRISVSGAGVPTGAVAISAGSAALASATLTGGGATVAVPTAGMTVGSHVLTVAYAGDAANAPSSSTVAVSVVARESRTTLKLSPATVDAGAAAHAVVAVSASGGMPTGTIEIKSGGKRIAHARLGRSGGARIKLPKTLDSGRHRLTAVYQGDASDKGSESKAKVLHVKKRAKARK